MTIGIRGSVPPFRNRTPDDVTGSFHLPSVLAHFPQLKQSEFITPGAPQSLLSGMYCSRGSDQSINTQLRTILRNCCALRARVWAGMGRKSLKSGCSKLSMYAALSRPCLCLCPRVPVPTHSDEGTMKLKFRSLCRISLATKESKVI